MLETVRTFLATPTGSAALTGFWVLFVADLYLWGKETTAWVPPGFNFSLAVKRWLFGFIMGAIKGAGIG